MDIVSTSSDEQNKSLAEEKLVDLGIDTDAHISTKIQYYEIVQRKHVVYVIVIKYGSLQWSIKRRFSEFFKLHKLLLRRYNKRDLPSLPKRQFGIVQGKFDDEFLELRRQLLDDYLEQVVVTADPDLEELLDDFLEFSEHLMFGTTSAIEHIPQLQEVVKNLQNALLPNSDEVSVNSNYDTERETRRDTENARGTSNSKNPFGQSELRSTRSVNSMASSVEEDDADSDDSHNETFQLRNNGESAAAKHAEDVRQVLISSLATLRQYALEFENHRENAEERVKTYEKNWSDLEMNIRGTRQELRELQELVSQEQKAKQQEYQTKLQQLRKLHRDSSILHREATEVERDIVGLKSAMDHHTRAYVSMLESLLRTRTERNDWLRQATKTRMHEKDNKSYSTQSRKGVDNGATTAGDTRTGSGNSEATGSNNITGCLLACARGVGYYEQLADFESALKRGEEAFIDLMQLVVLTLSNSDKIASDDAYGEIKDALQRFNSKVVSDFSGDIIDLICSSCLDSIDIAYQIHNPDKK